MTDVFRQKKWLLPVCVLLLTLLVRMVAMVVLAPTLDFTLPDNAFHGSEAYDEYARNLLETGVYGRTAGTPDSALPPLYSLALAIVYGVVGRGYVQMALFHTLLDMLSVALLMDIARRLFPDTPFAGLTIGQWTGIVAGVCMACYPYLVFQSLSAIDTAFWITLLHLFVWLMILLRERETFDRRTLLYTLAGGVVLGLSMLTRALLPLLAILVALWFLFRRSLWQNIIRLAIVAVVGVLVVTPWMIRNYTIHETFVTMTTTSGSNFWQGNSRWTVPVLQAGYDVQWTAPEDKSYRELSPAEADDELLERSLDYLRQNPDDIPQLLWTKFRVQWSVPITPRYNPQAGETFALTDEGEFRLVTDSGTRLPGVTDANASYNASLMDTVGRPLHVVYFGALLALALLGVLISLRYWREVSLLWFVQLSLTVMYVVFHPSTRYRAPTDPLLFIFSAYALVWLAQQIYHQRVKSR